MAKRYHGGIKLSDGPVFPKEVMFHECSEPYESLKINYRDTMAGVDEQIGEDTRYLHKGLDPQKV